MTNILYLANARLPSEKAHGFQIMKMCEAFAEVGADVTLYRAYRRQPTQDLETDPFDYYEISPSFQIKTVPGVDGIDWANRFFPQLKRFGFYIQSLVYTVNVVRATWSSWKSSDVIYFSRDIFTILVLLEFRNLIEGKIVFEAHTFPESWTMPIIRRLRKLDLLVTITNHLKKLFIDVDLPESRIIVEPDAVDLSQFDIEEDQQRCRNRLDLPQDRFIIGYIGRFYAMGMEKGIPQLIRAMSDLVKDPAEKKPLLTCVGGPMDRVPKYEHIAQKNGISSEYIKFIDRVPNSEVPYWVKACDICTIPWSRNKFSAYYTSPMKLFEYMASEVPIVASRLPALQEVLTDGDNAILHKPGNPDSVAASITKLRRNPELADEIASQAFRDVKQYTWARRAERILESVENQKVY